MFSAAIMPALVWRPALPPLALAIVMLLLAAMVLVQAQQLARRFGRRRAVPVVVARSLTVLLLLTAVLDPAVPRRSAAGPRRRLLVLVDRSASMKVRDANDTSREARADAVLRMLHDRLERMADLAVWSFADRVWKEPPPPADDTASGTDLGGALLTAADEAGAVDAVVLLSDGGDEPPEPPRLPRAALFACVIGADPATWRDTAVESFEGPPTVERRTTVELAAVLRAHSHQAPGFRETLARREVRLWHRHPDGTEALLETRQADLAGGQATMRFPVRCDDEGIHQFRIELDAGAGELSPLNNRRSLRIEARGESLDVLYFSRRLGADLKRLRQALGTDPALAFTALYRTGGERYTVQAPDGDDSGALERGLPTAPGALRRYDCLLLGAFPAELWQADEMRAVLDYVSEGGGLVWLGGEEAFEGGGYEASALAPLIPWRLRGGGSTLTREEAPLSIPPASASDPAVAGLAGILDEAYRAGGDRPITLSAFNLVRDLSPAARALIEVNRPQGRAPVLVAQPYGRGRVYAFASNTSWQWAGGPPAAATFYRRLWQQLARAAAGATEGGRHLQVVWEGNRLRPAGRTSARVQVIGAPDARLRATLTDTRGQQTLPLVPVPDVPDTWRAEMSFRTRGENRFRIEAVRDGAPLETYERTLLVAPPEDEGSRLGPQRAALERLTAREGGRAYAETEAGQMADDLLHTLQTGTRTELASVVSHPYGYALACLATLSAGWFLRRRLNLA